MFDKEMQDALKADAEKLRQLTGQDHQPVFMCDVPVCDCGWPDELCYCNNLRVPPPLTQRNSE